MQLLTGTAVMVADGIIIFLAYSLVITRMYFRLVNQRQSITASDMLLIAASLGLLGIFLCIIKEIELGSMEPHFVRTPQFLKWSFTAVVLYDITLYLLKFSILLFYFKLFPAGMLSLRTALYCALGLTAFCFLTALFMGLFWCGTDVNVMFDPHNKCSFWDVDLFLADWIMNITTDICICALPFPLLRKLDLTKRQIIGLAVNFGLGAVTMLVSILKYVSVQHHQFLSLYVWSVAELGTGIMVVSLPALRPLLRKASHVVSNRQTLRFGNRWTSGSRSPRAPSLVKSPSNDLRNEQFPTKEHEFHFDTNSIGSEIELHGSPRNSDRRPSEARHLRVREESYFNNQSSDEEQGLSRITSRVQEKPRQFT